MKKRIFSSLATALLLSFASSAYAQGVDICPHPTNYVVIQAGSVTPIIAVKPENEKESVDKSYIATYEFDQSGLPADTQYKAHCSKDPYAPAIKDFKQTFVDIPKTLRVCILKTEANRENGRFRCF